jgi:hypothetical protein
MERFGMSVRVDGIQAPMFIVYDDFFAIQIPEPVREVPRLHDATVYFEGKVAGRMIGSPVEVYPGKYVSTFRAVE